MTTDNALQVIEQSPDSGVVEWSLDNWPSQQFNRLIPVQTISMPTDLFRPVVQVVQLDPADRDGKSADTYKSTDVPSGHRALTARALNKLATAAAVSFLEEHRLDDGSDPDVIGVSVLASMVLPTGQRITAPGSQLVNLKTWFGAQTSDAEKAKFRKQFYAHVSTRAKNRAIRGLLSLRSSYPEADIAKPFAVVSYVPNMAHPEVRARVLDAIAPVSAQLYGSSAPTPQLAAGHAVSVAEAPEEDPAPARSDEPDWMQGSAPTKAAKPDFAVATRAFSTEGEDADELATAEDKDKLRAIFAGWEARVVGAGIRALWPDQEPNALSKGQARAIARVQESLGHDDFERAWKRIAEQQTASAAA